MNLIALLIGLVVERLATQLFHWRRMRWLDRIIDSGFEQAERIANWPSLIPVTLLAVVLVLPVFLVIFALGDTLAGFTYLLLAIVVLFFSLGPEDIGEEVDDYCRALESEDEEAIQIAAKAIVEGEVPPMRGSASSVWRNRSVCKRTTACLPSCSGSFCLARSARGPTGLPI